MRTPLTAVPAALLLALLLTVVLTACSSEPTGGSGDRADDPAGRSADPGPMPTSAPAAAGEVVTRAPVTVMDTGSPELCLGPVAESYPPQCGGPALVGWAWGDHGGELERVGDVRWGEFVVTGTWDGTSVTVASARAAGPGDRPVDDAPHPAPTHRLSADELAGIAEEVGDLGGARSAGGAYATQEQVLVDVVYDDGSLQSWADATYGVGVVLVTAGLVDA